MPDLDAVSGGLAHTIGSVIMWSGLLSNIPSGWQLADGTNGTTNLVSLFLRETDSNEEPGNQQGEDFHVLTTSEIPSHIHSTTGLGHRHEQELSSVTSAGGSTGLAGNTGAGNYDFKNQNAGGSFSSAGSNGQHENRPPFFELAYIQRVS